MKKLCALLCSCLLILLTGFTSKQTDITKSIDNFYYGIRYPVIIYHQIPFESGVLALADKIQDGEHYPELYYINNGKVQYHTAGSDCWMLNYTHFSGYYIFFGLGGAEIRPYPRIVSVKKVEAIFGNKTESAIPGKNIVAQLYPNKRNNRNIKNSSGYILPVKGQHIPDDIIAILNNGKKVSLLTTRIGIQELLQSESMPDYLKVNKANIYNSYAFKFSSMLSPKEWRQGYSEGEICLEGKTDERGNLNALNLRPAGHLKLTDSSFLPQDIRPFFLSHNFPETFSSGELVKVVYPGQRKLLDCHILSLAAQMVDNEVNRDSFTLIPVNEKNQIILPKEQGYYLFVLRTQNAEIQTYTGIFRILD